MTTPTRQRHEPTQARSRQKVALILKAAAELIDEAGIEAATTRRIAESAGVTVPSLYRFFADRDQILDRILSYEIAQLEQVAQEREASWEVTSVSDFVDRELELHVDFYEQHPSFVQLWFGGRISKSIVEEVHRRNRTLASRGHSALTSAGLVDPATPIAVFVLLVELGDRILDLAFRAGPLADRQVIDNGRAALTSYLESIAGRSA